MASSGPRKCCAQAIWRPAIAGAVVIALVLISGERSYLGLGVTAEDPQMVSITGSFSEGGANHGSWLWKTIYTAITLGGGFKGGEVTPFFMGATLGHSLALIAQDPSPSAPAYVWWGCSPPPAAHPWPAPSWVQNSLAGMPCP